MSDQRDTIDQIVNGHDVVNAPGKMKGSDDSDRANSTGQVTNGVPTKLSQALSSNVTTDVRRRPSVVDGLEDQSIEKHSPSIGPKSDHVPQGTGLDQNDIGEHAELKGSDNADDTLSTHGKEDESAKYDAFARDDEFTEDEPKMPDGDFITYKNRYTNKTDEDDLLWSQTAYEPILAKENTAGKSEERRSVFDVVTTFRSAVRYSSYDKPIFHGPPRVRAGSSHTIVIRSAAIMDALRHVVDYWPDVDLSGETVSLSRPYGFLVHHYEQLTAYRRGLASTDSDDICEKNEEANRHLGLLLEYLDSHVMADVAAERIRHEKGFVTYDMLWLLFRPGDDVAILNSTPAWRGGIVKRDGALLAGVDGGPKESYRAPWTFNTWSMHYDGKILERRTNIPIIIDSFDGEMELSRLEILPLDRTKPMPDGQSLRTYLEEQGRKWYAFLKPVCMHHEGEVLKFPFHRVNGQVMVDMCAYLEENSDYRGVIRASRNDGSARLKKSSAIPGCSCDSCEKERASEGESRPQTAVKFSNYDDIRPDITDELTAHQYLLCPQSIPVYAFKSRGWINVDVRNLSPCQWNENMIETLVMDEKRIKLLKALAKGWMRQDSSQPTRQHWTADFVKGKGNNQIILLHGQPGVGKTYTAECIAEYTKRPLMTLTCSDIGTEPGEVEQNLDKNFKTAQSWGAIMLIDEADIYLERRHQTDLTRNSLVAGFLRALEIYEGILFLTTNRVGSFDDAFISRIHVKLFYPSLSQADRGRIWNNFMEKLRAERGEHMKIMEDAEDYIESKKITSLQLNGREIRNIFQTAVGLAEFEEDRDKKDKRQRIKIKKEHIAQVAEMSGEFKNYLKEVLAGDESSRAEKSFLRIDDYDSKGRALEVIAS